MLEMYQLNGMTDLAEVNERFRRAEGEYLNSRTSEKHAKIQQGETNLMHSINWESFFTTKKTT